MICLHLQVREVPGFERIWHSLSSSREPNTNLEAMLGTPTPASHLIACLPPDAEKQLQFLLTQVRQGQDHRYKQWLHARWLCGASGEHTVIDMIRYLCVAYRRPADTSTTGITRWIILGWLLSLPRSEAFVQRAHNAAVMDWIHFNHKVDDLHFIDPGVKLLMHTLSAKHVHTARYMLEQIRDAAADNSDVIQHVATAVSVLSKKGLVRTLQPVLDCQLLPGELRTEFEKIIKPAMKLRAQAPARATDQVDASEQDMDVLKSRVAEALGMEQVQNYLSDPNSAKMTQLLLDSHWEHIQSGNMDSDATEQLLVDVVALISSFSDAPLATLASSPVVEGITSCLGGEAESEAPSIEKNTFILEVASALQVSASPAIHRMCC